MSELIIPSALDRLKICDEEISEYAEREPDASAVNAMAMVALRDIVPEMREWLNSRVRIETNSIHVQYPWVVSDNSREEISGGPFTITGHYTGNRVVNQVDSLGEGIDISRYRLCLDLDPSTVEVSNSSELQHELDRSEITIVPVSSLDDIEVLRVD